MSTRTQLRRESAAYLSTFTGALGEALVDTTNNRVQVHDGKTPGGHPHATFDDVPSIINMPYISQLMKLREWPSGLTAGVLGQKASAAQIAANDIALYTWFQARKSSAGKTAWLWGQGQNLVIDTSYGFGTYDVAGETADGMRVAIEGITFQVDTSNGFNVGAVNGASNTSAWAYGHGVVRLHGNNVGVELLGDVVFDRPFQPVPVDGDLQTYRNTYGQPIAIVAGGLGRYYTGPGGTVQTVSQNYRSMAQVICRGRTIVRNFSAAVMPTYVLEGLKVQGDIMAMYWIDTAFIPWNCATMGDWDGIKARYGGDDCFFAYHLATSPYAQAGGKPDGGKLINADLRYNRGKAGGLGGHGGFIIDNVRCDGNWAGGFAVIFGPYSNGAPTWAANSGIGKISNLLILNPCNMQFPVTSSTSTPQYKAPPPGYGYAGLYVNESSGTVLGPSRIKIDDITVENPGGAALVLSEATQVTAKNIRATPGSTTYNYANGAVTSVARTANSGAQLAAVNLANADNCTVDIELRTGPNGEKFPYAYLVQGASTVSCIIRGGETNVATDTFSISGEVDKSELSRGILAHPAPMQFAGSILPPSVAFATGQTVQLATNQIYLFYFPDAGLLTAVDFDITTAAAAGGMMRAGVYGCGLRGGVGKLILEATPVATTSTGNTGCVFANPVTMHSPFWLAVLPSANVTVAAGVVGSNRLMGLYQDDLVDGIKGVGVYGSLAYGALPLKLTGLNPSSNLAMIAARFST